MHSLPDSLETVLSTNHEPDAVFSALLPALCDVLQCDRCFLYLRNPYTKIGKVAYCWRRNPDVPDVRQDDFQPEPETLVQEDPMFAAADRAEPSIFVEDVETADPSVLNLAFEQKHFGHRALVHAHLRDAGLMWGILQPCMFGQPRVWSEFDRSIIAQLEARLTPLAVAYVKQNIPTPAANSN